MGIAKSHFNNTIDQEELSLKGYDFISCNYQLSIKRGELASMLKIHFQRMKCQALEHYRTV